jgi:glycosyltransferase involved in cell wall biosynthesis
MYCDRTVGLVLPARNEEKLIPKTLDAVPEFVDWVYVVDDCSTDSTRTIVAAHAESDPRITLICHEVNQGPGGAITTGYLRASQDECELVVVAGADFQMPFEQMADLLDPIIEGKAHYTKGNRFLMGRNTFEDMPKVRLMANTMLSLVTKISSGYYKVFDVVDGYTAITKTAIDAIDWDHVWKGYGYPMDFLVHLNVHGFKVKDVARRAIYLEGERQSQINGLSYALRVAPMLVRRFFWRIWSKYVFGNFHPLIFLYFISFLLIPCGLAIGGYIVLSKIQGLVPSAATAVACALVLNVGIQSLFFAMLFEMLDGD